MKIDVFEKMGERWPSAIVARTDVGRFSGGLLKSKTLANMDSQGVGPERVTVGRKVAYPVDSLVEWLRDRVN